MRRAPRDSPARAAQRWGGGRSVKHELLPHCVLARDTQPVGGREVAPRPSDVLCKCKLRTVWRIGPSLSISKSYYTMYSIGRL